MQMEQILTHLLADVSQEEMKAQMASLTSWINVNQEEMIAKMDA
jgi:hypothetical protein